MKKIKTVELTNWEINPHDPRDYIDVDWPAVQRSIGTDHLTWLLDQPRSHCQLIIERSSDSYRLLAEFYDTRCVTEYYLRWSP